MKVYSGNRRCVHLRPSSSPWQGLLTPRYRSNTQRQCCSCCCGLPSCETLSRRDITKRVQGLCGQERPRIRACAAHQATKPHGTSVYVAYLVCNSDFSAYYSMMMLRKVIGGLRRLSSAFLTICNPLKNVADSGDRARNCFKRCSEQRSCLNDIVGVLTNS